MEKQGVEITLIYSGSHKVDGTPTAIYRMMSGKHCSPGWMHPPDVCTEGVGIYRPVRAGCVDTEAAVYSGQEAIDAGLADNLLTVPMRSPSCVMHWMHVNPSLRRANDQRDSINNCFSHSSQADVTGVVQATEGENASARSRT